MSGYDSWKTRAPDIDGPEEPSYEQQKADHENELQQLDFGTCTSNPTRRTDMSTTVKLDLPDPVTGARHSVIRSILRDLVSHQMTMEEAVKALDHLAIASRVRHERAPKTDREYNSGDTPPIP